MTTPKPKWTYVFIGTLATQVGHGYSNSDIDRFRLIMPGLTIDLPGLVVFYTAANNPQIFIRNDYVQR